MRADSLLSEPAETLLIFTSFPCALSSDSGKVQVSELFHRDTVPLSAKPEAVDNDILLTKCQDSHSPQSDYRYLVR